MLKGLSLFAEHFDRYQDSYIVIGGTACYLNLWEQGLEFRATKDIDIVLFVEALSPAFFSRFWEFIHAGSYEICHKSNGKPIFYRFAKPAKPDYPAMLELFSRTSPAVELIPKSHLIPLPSSDETSSLSAILLDDAYYNYLHEGISTIQGITVAKPERLIPLKSKAWLDLSARKSRGELIDTVNITKHRKDILALFSIISPEEVYTLPPAIAIDVMAFLKTITDTGDPLLRIKSGIRQLYGL